MNRCQRFERQLAAYGDGDLGGYLRGEIEAHLAQCAGCRATLAAYQRSLTVVTAALNDGPPPSVGSVPSPIPARPFRPRWAYMAAAVCAVLAFAPLLGRNDGETRETAPAAVQAVDPERELLRLRILALESDLAALRAAYERSAQRPIEPVVDEREVTAAMTLAAGAYYERQSARQGEAAERYRYAATAYGDTPSGKIAQERLDTIAAQQSAKEKS